MTEDIASEYKYIFNRLNKLNKTITNVVKQNTELKAANARLRANEDTYHQTLAAQERVLKKLDDQLHSRH